MSEYDALAVAFFANKKDNRPSRAILTWRELVVLLGTHETREQKDGRLWSPTDYPEGVTRANANVQALTALVYELDDRDPDWPRLAGVRHIAHTTFSHGIPIVEQAPDGTTRAKPPAPRWRLVLALASPVPASDWRQMWRRARAIYAPAADPACKDAHRMYYLPSRPPNGPAPQVRIGAGSPVDPANLPPCADDVPEQPPLASPAARENGGDRPGDRFNAETSWAAILEPHGWRRGHDQGGREVWIRPGKPDQDAHSANTTPDGNLYVWSSNAGPFEPGQSYSKLAAYALLEHGGDLRGAVRALGERYDPRLIVDVPRVRRLPIPRRATNVVRLAAPAPATNVKRLEVPACAH